MQVRSQVRSVVAELRFEEPHAGLQDWPATFDFLDFTQHSGAGDTEAPRSGPREVKIPRTRRRLALE